MLKLLIRLALHLNFRATLRTAAKLEYGAGIFCFKLALRAQEEGHLNLAQFLKQQFAEEDSHARMLGGLVDRGSRLHRNCQTGVWKKEQDYQFLDGISQRYWAAKLFFGFKKPEELDWADTLAFMCVIENKVALFYEVLREDGDSAVLAIALKILADETQHADYLKNFLHSFDSNPEGIYMKWRSRTIYAYVGGFLDLLIGHWASGLS